MPFRPNENSGILKRIWAKARYGVLFQECLDRLGRFGVKIEFFYLILDHGSVSREISRIDRKGEYETGFLKKPELMDLTEMPWSGLSEKQIISWLGRGRACYGLKESGKILSFLWCDFNECLHLNLRIPLEENEAYMFNGYTRVGSRGKNLIGILHSALYRELAAAGRNRLYSFVSAFNSPSLRIKKLIPSRRAKLYLHIGLKARWKRTYCLWSFHSKGSVFQNSHESSGTRGDFN
jgi:hypothetical protein